MNQDMNREEFILFLIDRGWDRQDAEDEWELRQDDESGYDCA